MEISQMRDKVNIPQKVGLQADLKKHWSLSQMSDTRCCLFLCGVVEQRPSIRAVKLAWEFGSLLQVTG